MQIVGLICIVLSVVVHVYIWILESFLWTKLGTRKTFGISEHEAMITKPLAYNQGFYNLFLAIITICGVGLYMTNRNMGDVLIVAGSGSMVLAGVVLLLSDRTKLRPAFVQIIPPSLGLLLLFI
jgi:putative membrane protein